MVFSKYYNYFEYRKQSSCRLLRILGLNRSTFSRSRRLLFQLALCQLLAAFILLCYLLMVVHLVWGYGLGSTGRSLLNHLTFAVGVTLHLHFLLTHGLAVHAGRARSWWSTLTSRRSSASLLINKFLQKRSKN